MVLEEEEAGAELEELDAASFAAPPPPPPALAANTSAAAPITHAPTLSAGTKSKTLDFCQGTLSATWGGEEDVGGKRLREKESEFFLFLSS